MGGVSMEDISKMVSKAVQEATDDLKKEFNETNLAIKAELDSLKAENFELQKRIIDMERVTEKNEQYNRKTSLILGGGGVPLPPSDHVETTSETRAMAAKLSDPYFRRWVVTGMKYHQTKS